MLPLFDLAPVRRFALVTYALIAANIAIFVWEEHARSVRVDRYAFYPCALHGPCLGAARDHLAWPEGVLTGMFLHASWWHVLGNMLFLFIFGNNVEDVMGRIRFLVFYVACGLVAALAQSWVTIHYGSLGSASIPTVGASGAIAGVLGAYLVLLPHARVVTLIGIFPIPVSATIFIGIWFVIQLWEANFSITHPQSGGGVAFAAHVGGFAFGLATVRLLQVRAPLRPRR